LMTRRDDAKPRKIVVEVLVSAGRIGSHTPSNAEIDEWYSQMRYHMTRRDPAWNQFEIIAWHDKSVEAGNDNSGGEK
jgi:hypothetical protein